MSQASSVVCVGFQTETLVSQMCEEFDVRWKIMSKGSKLDSKAGNLCVCVCVLCVLNLDSVSLVSDIYV